MDFLVLRELLFERILSFSEEESLWQNNCADATVLCKCAHGELNSCRDFIIVFNANVLDFPIDLLFLGHFALFLFDGAAVLEFLVAPFRLIATLRGIHEEIVYEAIAKGGLRTTNNRFSQ